MSANELRKHITLVESYNNGITEIDATRRGLFKSAAALAAVAAIPAPVKAQAVELIKDKGAEFLRLVIDVIKHGITFKDIDYVDEFGMEYYGERGMRDPHPVDIFPNNKRRAAIRHITGIDPGEDTYVPAYTGDPDEDGEDHKLNILPDWEKRLRGIMGKMTDDQKFELLKNTWQAVGLGNPGFYHWYMIKKKYPEFEWETPNMLWARLHDFMYPSKDGTKPGLSQLQIELSDVESYLAKIPNDPAAKDRVEYLKKAIRDYEAASKMLGHKGTGGATPAATRQGGSAGVGTRALLSPVLRAVDVMFQALRKVDKISNSALDVLANVNPDNIKVALEPKTSAAGQPTGPRALPAPGDTLGINPDLAHRPDAVPVKK